MEALIKNLEKMMAGRIIRGVLWMFAFVLAKTGTEAPDDDAATTIGTWVAGVACALIALAWSAAKDKIWKKEPPPAS